jgi:acyl-CoA synthetase (AMP-forming)/AMP-acid ligase II
VSGPPLFLTPPQVPALHFAAAALRAIIVNINVNLAPQELAYILADSAADIVVSAPEFAPALQAAAAAAAAAASAATADPSHPDPTIPAADSAPLCIHTAVWVTPGQPLQTPTSPTGPAVNHGLPEVPGWRSCPYPFGTFIATDVAGNAPAEPSTGMAAQQHRHWHYRSVN